MYVVKLPFLLEVNFSISKTIMQGNCVNCFACYKPGLLLSPHGKRHGPSFEQSWIPFTQGCFVLSQVQWFLRRRWKSCEKYTDWPTNRWTDRRLTTGVIRQAQLSFQLRWVKKQSKSVNKLIRETMPQQSTYINCRLCSRNNLVGIVKLYTHCS